MPRTERKLGVKTAHRMSMLYGMVTDLLEKGEITTTLTRAQEVQAIADSMITLGKKGGLAAYRDAMAKLTKRSVVIKLFDIIAPQYAKRAGGYTQIFKLGPRRGDAAEMALLRLMTPDKEEAPVVEEKPKKTTTRKKAAADKTEAAPKKTTTRKKAAPKTEEAPAPEAPATEEAAAE